MTIALQVVDAGDGAVDADKELAARTAELAAAKARIAESEAAHAAEIVELKKAHAAEVARIEAAYDRVIAELGSSGSAAASPSRGASTLARAKQARAHQRELSAIKLEAAEKVAQQAATLADASATRARDMRRLSSGPLPPTSVAPQSSGAALPPTAAAPARTARPALRKRLSVSVAPKRLSVNPFVIAVRPALRDTRRVVVAKEGALGIELMARYDERSTCIVVEVVKVKEGSQMEALGVRVGDWVERVHDVSIDLMNEADLDGDGKISIQELQTLLDGIRSVAPTEAYEDELIYPSAEVLMKRYDLEGDQTLTPGELTELVNHELLSAIVRLITTTARPFEVVCTTLERSVAVAANGAAAAALDAASGAVKAAGLSATNAEGHVNSAKLLNVTRQAKSGALFRPGKKVRGNRRGSAMLGQATHSAHHIEGMLHKKGNGALGRYQARVFSTSGRTC